jgi:hypothetical protein
MAVEAGSHDQYSLPSILMEGSASEEGRKPRDGGGSWFPRPVLPAINIDERKRQ